MTVKKAERKAELPFAAIPLLFGVQQILEGIIFVVVYRIYTLWFISVWCFFAALLSAVVYLHFRNREQGPVSV